MHRYFATMPVAALVVTLIFAVSLTTITTGAPPIKSCATPTPGGTVPLAANAPLRPIVLELAAMRNVTLTTVYTLTNVDIFPGETQHQILAYPNCDNIGGLRSEHLDFKPKRYLLDDVFGLPSTFNGVIYVSSSIVITGVSEIVSRVTPVVTPAIKPVYMPVVLAMPTPLPFIPTFTPTPTRVPGSDAEAPHLVRWSFSPERVNVSESSQIITFTVRITDNLSGLINSSATTSMTIPQAQFENPSFETLYVYFRNPADLISGTAKDGIYRSVLVVPRSAEPGDWRIDYLLLTDNAGNRILMTDDYFGNRGLLTTFHVEN